ncbi:hypothetical protein LTS10_012385 [Elasticomyces elasticus]|nr:hypothetical protein LTS10_012385 [Elasticomyces elasticus]
MASTTGSNQYSYVKASQMATRSLVGDEKPEHTISSASHDHPDAHDKPIVAGKSTDNYEQAAATAAKEGKGEGMATLSGTDRPGLGRQQSWSMQDKRRQHHEGLLDSKAAEAEGGEAPTKRSAT